MVIYLCQLDLMERLVIVYDDMYKFIQEPFLAFYHFMVFVIEYVAVKEEILLLF